MRHNTCILSVAVIFALSKAMPHIVSAHTHTHTLPLSPTIQIYIPSLSLLFLSHGTLKSTKYRLALLIKAMSGVTPINYTPERTVQQLLHVHVTVTYALMYTSSIGIYSPNVILNMSVGECIDMFTVRSILMLHLALSLIQV